MEFFNEESKTTIAQQKAIDAIRKMSDEDVELIMGVIERVRRTD